MFDDGHAKINLIGPEGVPVLIWAENLKANDLRRAMQMVHEEQEAFLDRWREIHG